MKFQNIFLVHVYYMTGSEKHYMGRLALKERKIYFEYTSDFLKTGLQLSPFKLPLKPGVIGCEDRVFEGLFGVFNDSLPDGWGRLLLDRKMNKMRLNPGVLSPLDRLCFVGTVGMGALSYEPETTDHSNSLNQDLDVIAEEIKNFQENEENYFVEDLLALGGSSAGARPKIVTKFGKEDWLIKFRSSIDPKDIGPIEFAYNLMAKEANLEVPCFKLFPSKNGPDYFGVQRFDRLQDKRYHMHTISGLLHADHREPSLDYETIIKVTALLTRDIRECEKLFRRVVFNVLSHNRDDHAKNFSFLMDVKGAWTVSPAYDLTFSSGPGGEHCTMVMGEGKNPTLNHLLKLAEISNIKKPQALKIIEEVQQAVSQWDRFAKDSGVSKSSQNMIQLALNEVKSSFT